MSLILDGGKSVLHEEAGRSASTLSEVLGDWFLTRADAGGSTYLWTGTFDPRRLRTAPGRAPRDYVGRLAASTALNRWHDQLIAYAPGADALVGLEAHKSGARHAHALVVAPPDFQYRQVARAWFADHGFNRWEVVDRERAAARYAAKYVGKELGVYDVAFDGGRLRL